MIHIPFFLSYLCMHTNYCCCCRCCRNCCSDADTDDADDDSPRSKFPQSVVANPPSPSQKNTKRKEEEKEKVVKAFQNTWSVPYRSSLIDLID